MPVALLALLLTWAPVTLDCHGQPESIDHYEVKYEAWWCDGWDVDFAPSCNRLMLDEPVSSTSFEADGLVNPPVGAGWWYEITAVDWAGNRSDDPCQ